MNGKLIFEKGMFWILILTFCITNYFSGIEIRGVNKTVGWTYDQSNFWILYGFVVFGSWLIFLIGYGIAALMRKKTNFSLSIIHYLIFIVTITIKNDLLGTGSILINLFSLLIFGINIYKTFKQKKKKIATQ